DTHTQVTITTSTLQFIVANSDGFINIAGMDLIPSLLYSGFPGGLCSCHVMLCHVVPCQYVVLCFCVYVVMCLCACVCFSLLVCLVSLLDANLVQLGSRRLNVSDPDYCHNNVTTSSIDDPTQQQQSRIQIEKQMETIYGKNTLH